MTNEFRRQNQMRKENSLLQDLKAVIDKHLAKPNLSDWPKFKVGSKVRFICDHEIRYGYIHSAMICGNETHYTLIENPPIQYVNHKAEHYRAERELAII